MMDSLLNDYKNNNQKSALDNYSINDLMELYITYARPKYFREHGNMGDILKYISSYIIDNMTKNYFLNNLDLYAKLMIELIKLENMIESTDNIIRIRNYNLQDEFFLGFEANTYKTDKDTFKDNYQKELDHIIDNNNLYKQILQLMDTFQKDMLLKLNDYIDTLSDIEKDNLSLDINKKIDENSLEIIKRIELKQDKKRLELHSRFKDISISELLDSLDITYLKEQNYVYSNFHELLNNLSIKNNK